MTLCEFFWPNGERPGWALRWSVDYVAAHVEICTASGFGPERPEEDFVLSDGGCSDMLPLDGPWVAEISMEIKFDGFARMWCEDLQLGTVDEAVTLADLLRHVYARADELIRHEAGRRGLKS